MSDRLQAEVRQLLAEAAHRVGEDDRATIARIEARLDEPLRVAVAGQLKTGKSTLLNALVGEELAATDAGECTRVVTWYRQGLTRDVALRFRDGRQERVAFERGAGGLSFTLDGHAMNAIEDVHVSWPASALETITMIDTPGLGSTSPEIAERTERFFAGAAEVGSPVDAVIYLVRHMHEADDGFLEVFRQQQAAGTGPATAIVVLARADEIGAGRLDSMESAARIAARYSADPKMRRLSAMTLPVAALLGQAASSLREEDYRLLSSIASSPSEERDPLLLSADRFATSAGGYLAERGQLLRRFGLFGVRLSVDWIARGVVGSAAELARALSDHSGLPRLRRELEAQFGARSGVLKARSAIAALEPIAARLRSDGDEWLDREIERILAHAHEFTEMDLIAALRSGSPPSGIDDSEEVERLLGLRGNAPGDRLGAASETSQEDLTLMTRRQLDRWQRRAEHPLSDPSTSALARSLVRTCEGILVELAR